MSIIKRISLKIFLTISIFLSFIAILLITISVLLTSKPQTGLLIVDKLFIDSYEIGFWKLTINQVNLMKVDKRWFGCLKMPI